MKDYSHLLGKEFVLEREEGRYDCFLVAIDREKGITAKGIDDQKDWVCLNRNSVVSNSVSGSVEEGTKLYNFTFDYIVAGIEKGFLSHNNDPNFGTKGRHGGFGMANCAFE